MSGANNHEALSEICRAEIQGLRAHGNALLYVAQQSIGQLDRIAAILDPDAPKTEDLWKTFRPRREALGLSEKKLGDECFFCRSHINAVSRGQRGKEGDAIMIIHETLTRLEAEAKVKRQNEPPTARAIPIEIPLVKEPPIRIVEEHIGVIFKKRREFLGQTQVQSALQSGLTRHVVSDIETGRHFNATGISRIETVLSDWAYEKAMLDSKAKS